MSGSSDDDESGPPPPALCSTGDFTRPPALVTTGPASSSNGGTQVFNGSNIFGDYQPIGGGAGSSPSTLHSPTSLHSPASSFRWDRHQSFRLYATHSRAMMSRRATGTSFDRTDSISENLGGSENFGASPVMPGSLAGSTGGGAGGATSDAATAVRTAQTKLKNYIMLNGAITVSTDSTLPINIRKGKLIGSGGYADVYSGINTQTGSLVAIKEIKIGDRSSPEEFRDIQEEFALLRRLKHPNVVRYMLFEHSVSQRVCRIVMEFMPGGSTQQLLQKFGPLPEPILKKFATDMLRGVEFIHKENITHRDIKPANILVDATGTVKLADFGASKRINEINTATKNLIGTPVYMAPEFIKGQMDPKSDVWSVGCTLLELSTGKIPWHHLRIKEHLPLMFHITTSSDIPQLPGDISDDFRSFFLQCFERNVSKRPTATELLNHPWIVNITTDDMEGQQAIEDIGADQTTTICHTLTTEEKLLGDSMVLVTPNAANSVVGSSPLESPDLTPKTANLSPQEAKLSSAKLKPQGSFYGGAVAPAAAGGGGSPKHALVDDPHNEAPQYLAIRQGEDGKMLALETIYDVVGEDSNGGMSANDENAERPDDVNPFGADGESVETASPHSEFGSFSGITITNAAGGTTQPPSASDAVARRVSGASSQSPSGGSPVHHARTPSNALDIQPRLALDGPVRMSFSFNSRGRKVDLGLEIDPRDVSMKVVDRRPSFVVAMNDRVRSQISKAMMDLGADTMLESPERSPAASPLEITAEGAAPSRPRTSSPRGADSSLLGRQMSESPGSSGSQSPSSGSHPATGTTPPAIHIG